MSCQSDWFTLPRVLRILIVDDKVAANKSLQNYLTDTLLSIAVSVENGHLIDKVDVVYRATPKKGYELWHSETFDLSLIDSHFETASRQKTFEFEDEATAFNAKYQGLILYNILSAQMAKREVCAYRNGMTKLVVWSCLKPQDIYDYPCQGADHEKPALVPKEDIQKFREAVQKAARRVIAGTFSPSQMIERFLTLFAFEPTEPLEEWNKPGYDRTGATKTFRYLIHDPGGTHFPFLPKLAQNENDDAVRISYHLPLQTLIDQQGGAAQFRYLDLRVLAAKARDGRHLDLFKCIDHIVGKQQAADLQPSDEPPPRCVFYPPLVKTTVPKGTECVFLDEEFPNGRFAAATPLTGVSVVGQKFACETLLQKVQALLCGGFGGVVLKTCYLDSQDQWEDVFWPTIQAQSHMRSRCLFPSTGTATLWNAGRTALEMFPPPVLRLFLEALSEKMPFETHRIIVSLGSKYHCPGEIRRGYEATARAEYRAIWRSLFTQVFGQPSASESSSTNFPLVEINVRHFLREIVEYYLGGDEYLNPTRVDEKCLSDVDCFWKEYGIWQEAVHQVGKEWGKKLILKLPHRGDSLALVRYAISLRKRELSSDPECQHGVRAVTLVNALKTPPPLTNGCRHTADGYADPLAWGDAAEKVGKYQMSGELVSPFRDQLLAGIHASSGMTFAIKDERGNENGQKPYIEFMLSGGITSEAQEIRARSALGRKDAPVQIGTWGLLDYNYTTGKLGAGFGGVKSPNRDESPAGSESPTQAIGARIIFLHEDACIRCGRCRRTHCCDAFLDRDVKHTRAVPHLDNRNCTGCGLCAQVCPAGALQLYDPRQMIVLIDNEYSRSAILNELSVPHIRLGKQAEECVGVVIEQLGFPLPPIDENAQRLSRLEQSDATRTELHDILKEICKKRVGLNPSRYGRDQYCLSKGKETIYPEDRHRALFPNGQFVGQSLADVAISQTDPTMREAAIRAAIWAILIWTDPGRLLAEAPLVSIRNVIGSDVWDGSTASPAKGARWKRFLNCANGLVPEMKRLG